MRGPDPGAPRVRPTALAPDEALRDPAQIVALWEEAGAVEPELLQYRADDRWWALLASLGITLLVTREYEHFAVALGTLQGRPHLSFLRLPHPSGLVVDRARGGLTRIASTRNPNQVFTLAPAGETDGARGPDQPLMPLATTFYPGSLYLHDLALVGHRLHANAVGQNAVVELSPDGAYRRVWWPRSIERNGQPDFAHNYLQLNSIAAGRGLAGSYFSASTDRPGRRRPGHLNFPVDRRGVIFSGRTREPVAWGLTRPHSARLDQGVLWVDNSGYGEVGVLRNAAFEAVARLPGWTRGLCFVGDVAFVGTSRVLPRFRRYAPGVKAARCAVHALSVRTGTILASLTWPAGNQIFGVDWCPSSITTGFPFRPGSASARAARARELFFSLQPARRERCPA